MDALWHPYPVSLTVPVYVSLSVLACTILAGHLLRKGQLLRLAPPNQSSWIWGHELVIFRNQACYEYAAWASLLGPVYRIKAALFQRDIIVVADNTAVQHILRNPYRYIKAPAFRPLVVKLIGRGLVWAEGEEHKSQRRLLAPAFTLDATKAMAGDAVECAQRLVDQLSNVIQSQGSTQATVNIVPYVSSCALDIIGLVAFGHDFGGGQSPEAQDIASSWHKDVQLGHSFGGFLAPIVLNPWLRMFRAWTEGLSPSRTKHSRMSLDIVKIISFVPQREITRCQQCLPIPMLQTDGIAKNIVLKLASHLLKANQGDPDGKDIMSLLRKGQDSDPSALSDFYLLENLATFMMVGHETSAVVANNTLLQLARHPEIQDKLRAEVQDASTDFDGIDKLAYLDAVVKEGLRMHPALPRTERVVVQDDVIPLSKPIQTEDGKTITSLPVKAGQVFHIPFMYINLNAEVWGEDAHQFKPERWLAPDGVPSRSELPTGPWANVSSFSDGPRGCIGWRLAVLEIKVIVMFLIRSIELRDIGADIRQYATPTLQAFVDGEGGRMPLLASLVQQKS